MLSNDLIIYIGLFLENNNNLSKVFPNIEFKHSRLILSHAFSDNSLKQEEFYKSQTRWIINDLIFIYKNKNYLEELILDSNYNINKILKICNNINQLRISHAYYEELPDYFPKKLKSLFLDNNSYKIDLSNLTLYQDLISLEIQDCVVNSLPEFPNKIKKLILCGIDVIKMEKELFFPDSIEKLFYFMVNGIKVKNKIKLPKNIKVFLTNKDIFEKNDSFKNLNYYYEKSDYSYFFSENDYLINPSYPPRRMSEEYFGLISK